MGSAGKGRRIARREATSCCIGIHRNLALKDLADQIFAEIVQFAAESRKLLVKQQLVDAAESVSRNIGEAFGRGTKRDRNRVLFIARLHHRCVTLVKMIDSIMRT